MMRACMIVFVASTACNAIDGVDGYEKSDANGDGAACPSTCIQSASSCKEGCDATQSTCVAACGNEGCINKCTSSFTTCTNDCVTSCESCDDACAASACEGAPVADAAAE